MFCWTAGESDETPWLCLPHTENHIVKYFRLKYFEFKEQSNNAFVCSSSITNEGIGILCPVL